MGSEAMLGPKNPLLLTIVAGLAKGTVAAMKCADAMAPENVSPLVVWLGSAESRDVTGKVFEVEGGIIRVAEGWAHGPQVDKGVKWDPAELGPVVSDLLAKSRPPVPVYGA